MIVKRSSQTLTWDLAGTASCCPLLNILISRDGMRFENLLSDINNDDVAIVHLPSLFPTSPDTRLKLECATSTSVKFYNVTDVPFKVIGDCV